MKKIILCLLIAVFSCGYFLPFVHAEDCLIDKTGKEINFPIDCTPSQTTEPTQTPAQNDQPATDTTTKPTLQELKRTSEDAITARIEAEKEFEEEKLLYEEMRSMGIDEESLNLIQSDRDAREAELKEAKELESKALDTFREQAKEADYNQRHSFIDKIEAQRKKIVSRGVSLPDMGITIGSEITTTKALFANVIKFLAGSIGIVAVLSIMVGGVILTVSSGNEDLQSKAKDIILYSIIAIVCVLSAYAIVTGVQQVIYSLGK